MNTRKQMLTGLTSAALAAALFASVAKSAWAGDIYSIEPVWGDETSFRMNTSECSDNPLMLGEQGTFVFRLYNPGVQTNGALRGAGKNWKLVFKGAGSEVLANLTDALPGIGVIVSGRLKYASIVDVAPTPGGNGGGYGLNFTDVKCRYIVEGGDIALPLTLADEHGIEIGANDSSASYYFYNPYAWWSIEDEDGNPVTLSFGMANAPADIVVKPKANRNFSLASLADSIYIRAVDFDDDYDTSETPTYWRRVYEGMTTTKTSQPSIYVPGGNTTNEVTTLYLWVEDTNCVRLVDAGDSYSGTVRRGSDLVSLEFPVQKVTLAKGQTNLTFRLEGVTAGTSAQVFLAATPGYRTNPANDVITNFVTRTVYCETAPDPFISITFARDDTEDETTATTNYQRSAKTMYVKLSKEYDRDIWVDINPTVIGNESFDLFGEKVIGISLNDGNYNNTFTNRIVKVPAGKTQVPFYVYALGSTPDTAAYEGGITFTPTIADESFPAPADAEAAHAFFNGEFKFSRLRVDDQAPVIVSPENGKTYSGWVAQSEQTVSLKIKDNYRDLLPTGSYTVSWNGEGSVEIEPDTISPTNEWLKFNVKYSREGNYTATVVVKDQNGHESEEITLNINVLAPKTISAGLYDSASQTEPNQRVEYAEGENPVLKFSLSQPHTSDLYAFLVPLNEASSNLVSCAAIEDGVVIPATEKNSTPINFRLKFLDGGDQAANIKFGIMLRSSSRYDDGEEISGVYTMKELRIGVTNIPPSVTSVEINNWPVGDGQTYEIPVASGVPTKFDALLTDPAIVDITNGLVTLWKVYDGQQAKDFLVTNDSVNASFSYTFMKGGVTNKVEVSAQDKDMATTGAFGPKYTFFVTVDKPPYVKVINNHADKHYDEDSKDGYIEVELSTPASEDLTIEVVATRQGLDGILTFVTNIVTVAAGDIYSVPQNIRFADLDGTVDSKSAGFLVTASVTTSTSNEYGVAWSEYYRPGTETVFIDNVPPRIKRPTEQAAMITNRVTLGSTVTIPWSVADIQEDLTNGLEVTWISSSGEEVTFTGPDVATGVFTNMFLAPGNADVTLIVTDKDGDMDTRVLHYTVPSTKEVTINPYGPSASTLTKYDTATGRGKGRVWGNSGAYTISNFRHTWSYDVSAAQAQIHAFGYAASNLNNAGNPIPYYDNGSLNGSRMDVAITSEGNKWATGDSYYKYQNQYDNFFYCWVDVSQTACLDTANVPVSGVPHPAATPLADTMVTVTLDAYEEDKVAYEVRNIEAIFAKEKFASDNMGDINADGIPDLYYKTFWYGATADGGANAEDDLVNLSQFNDDNDFLPGRGQATSTLIPGLPESWVSEGSPFTAYLEIRGFGDGLNNAPAQFSFDSTPELDFKNPSYDAMMRKWSAEAGTVGIDWIGVEWLAYNELSDAEKESWSPENPTDPTKEDTDGDGFTDGYEYYYWYYAKVGYIDEVTGRHVYLTGSRYNPADPARGDVITSAEIAMLFDPNIFNARSATRDSDNDGLTDLEEFYLGTNPIQWDTDGDGLPDGYEVMIGTNPLTATTNPGEHDAYTNPDRDYMAYSLIGKKYGDAADMRVFGVRDPKDGHVKYVAMRDDAEVTTEVTAEAQYGWLVQVVDEEGNVTDYFTYGDAYGEVPCGENADGDIVLACELGEYVTWEARQTADGDLVRGAPTFLPRGTVLASDPDPTAEWYDEVFSMTWKKDDPQPNHAWRAWQYGKNTAPVCDNCAGTGKVTDNTVIPPVEVDCPRCDGTGYLYSNTISWGNYMLGLDIDIAPGLVVLFEVEKPSIGLVHHYVYQWRQFDPRTAWGEPDPPYGSVNTRPFCTYDEFLLISFFYNTGALNENAIKARTSTEMLSRWGQYNTNPLAGTAANNTGLDVTQTVAGSGNHGADTDGDGVPDGWELYVMAGPKQDDGRFSVAGPTADSSPLVAKVWSTPTTMGDTDGINNVEEFEGRESTAWYAEYCPTIKHAEGWAWTNKHWPTDPWNNDTDDDGISDDAEKTAFAYGTPASDGPANHSNPGGGLNPLSWDTDGDGLPDPWELQFAGSATAVAGATGTGNTTDAAAGQTMEIVNGMDGTVNDAEKDYDADGLVNWQEYQTGWMRCWRYDDPMGPWGNMPEVDTDSTDLDYWARVVMDRDDPTIYNPHIASTFDPTAYYGSLQTNDWDVIAYKKWHFFYDGPYHDLAKPQAKYKVGTIQHNRWTYYASTVLGIPNGQFPGQIQYLQMPQETKAVCARKYFTCDPTNPDSDGDGMDDFYEVFHGMNPILGTPMTSGDLIFDAYGGMQVLGMKFNGESTYRSTECTYDFVLEPWLAGVPTADPDGDNIRNQEEAIMPQVQALSTWHHTDPTPLWMTDTSYAAGADPDTEPGSLTSRYYLPTTSTGAGLPDLTFQFDSDGDGTPETHAFSQFVDVYVEMDGAAWFNPWNYAPAGVNVIPMPGSMYSFEQNEGYDSDHDGLSDFAEAQGRYRNASDAQDDDSPRRHQAMYFNGTDAFLETLPEAEEDGEGAPNNNLREMLFLEYTVEAWVKAEEPSGRAQTIVERAIASGVSHVGDEKYIRRNFSIGIDANGFWCAKHDSRGTDALQTVEVTGTKATTEWTHIAATFGAKAGEHAKLTLYINGTAVNTLDTDVQPENGTAAITIDGVGAFDEKSPCAAVALLVGTGTDAEADPDGQGIWALMPFYMPEYSNFTGYFKGYVDEVRIWDGARSADQIAANYKKRFTADDLRENRAIFYNQFVGLGARSDAANEDLEPEIRYMFGFDHSFGADSPEHVAKVPAGFSYSGVDGKAILSRPAGYVCGWWAELPCVSTVYTDYAWVPWINNTYAHLDRFDGTTKDSRYWSKYYAGRESAQSQGLSMFSYPQTHELYCYWKQAAFGTAAKYEMFTSSTNQADQAMAQAYTFTRRQQLTCGADLLPFGGAFAKYAETMWDDGKPSSTWEITGTDSDNDGLPDWWEAEYGDVGWDDKVTYNGVEMTAGEAYIRSLAAGAHEGSPDGDELYAQTSDLDKDGIPDWWEQIYKIESAGGNDDTDGDGLSNYTEYVISEAFRSLGVYLSPVKLRSDDVTLDYFRTVGYLYIGEMFTDHDMMEDDWELSLGDLDYASPWVWDANKDKDEDGWSNFAECRYNKFRSTLVANLISHMIGTEEVRDFPKPTVLATFRYHGSQSLLANDGNGAAASSGNGSEDVPGANIVVTAYPSTNRDPALFVGQLQIADATFSITPGSTISDTLYIGSWEERVVHVTFGPYLNFDSLELEVARLPRNDSYTWTENGNAYNGTYNDFMSAFRANPQGVRLSTADFEWSTLNDKFITVTTDSTGVRGYICYNGERAGEIDLQTGEATMDLSPLKQYATQLTSRTDSAGNTQTVTGAVWPLTDALIRINYSSKVPTVQKNKLTVSLSNPVSGYLKEGLTTFVAFVDLNSDNTYTPGEPMGMVRNVDVGWGTCSFDMELTDLNPVSPRVRLSDLINDREEFFGTESGNYTNVVAGTLSGGRFERLRVIRSWVDGIRCADLGVPYRQVLDTWVNIEDCRDYLFEGDFLTDEVLDIDWEYMVSEVLNNSNVRNRNLLVTNVAYRVVLGNGDTDAALSTTNNLLGIGITRSFDATRQIATPVSPVNGRTLYSSQPTFEWSMGALDTYTAFRIRVYSGTSTTVVYDSDIRPVPPRNSRGNYEWTAPLYANSLTSSGKIFSSTNNYTWTVSMFNSKFRSEAPSAKTTTNFRMNTNSTKPVADNGYTVIGARVSYYGPDKVIATVATTSNLRGKVRVQAYSTPDFSGDPVAETVVIDKDSLSSTDRAVNAMITGLPKGSWYVRAYIDTNGNLKRDEWESWGYACNREGKVPGYSRFSPVPVVIDDDTVAMPECDVYIEDCDTDGDWFPDAYEMVEKGSLTTLGPVSSSSGLVNVNPDLKTSVSHELSASLCTLAGPDIDTLQDAAMAALILGLDTAGSSSPRAAVAAALNAQTLEPDGVSIKNIAVNGGVVSVTSDVDLSVNAGGLSTAASIYTGQVSGDVVYKVWYKKNLTDEKWTLLSTQTKYLSESGEVTSDIQITGTVDPESGFFKVTLE